MTHSFIAINISMTQMVSGPVEGFALVHWEAYDKALPDELWVKSVCLAGDEFEAIGRIIDLIKNPEPVGYYYDMDDHEPEYTLGGRPSYH
jgi:hypothetical protein